MDVDESCKCLDWTTLLGVVEKVTLTRLIFGIPFKDVELGIVCSLTRRSMLIGYGRIVESSESSVLKLLVNLDVLRVYGIHLTTLARRLRLGCDDIL